MPPQRTRGGGNSVSRRTAPIYETQGARSAMTDATDPPIELDRHRGMAAQKATEIRRLLAEVEANESMLRERQQQLEAQLLAAPAATWVEAAEKARYLLRLFAATPYAQDPRRQTLIGAVIEDFARLSRTDPGDTTS